MALIFTVRDHQRWLAPGDFTAHRPGVDISGDGCSFLHFGGARSEVCCLLLFPVSRRVWGNMELAGLLAVSKGRENPHLVTTSILMATSHWATSPQSGRCLVAVAQVLSVDLSSL